MRMLLSLVVVGCTLPPAVRPARILRGGEVLIGSYFGGTFGPDHLPDATLELGGNFAAHARVGVAGRCDVGAIVGGERFGADARCAVLDAGRGAPLTIAPYATWAFQPLRGHELGAGLDLGAAFGVFEPLVSLGMTRGGELVFTPDAVTPGGDASAYTAGSRVETRIVARIGTALRFLDGNIARYLLLSVDPYWRIHAGGSAGLAPDGFAFTLGFGQTL